MNEVEPETVYAYNNGLGLNSNPIFRLRLFRGENKRNFYKKQS